MDTDSVRKPAAASDLLTEITRFGVALREAELGATEAETLAGITALEELKAAVVSAQARETVVFEQLRIERDRANGVPERGSGVRAGDEAGLAKRVSPVSGRKFLTNSRAIVIDMPNTFKALAEGTISEDKARIMVDETAVLDLADRRRVDTRMRDSMGSAELRSLRTEVRALSCEIDAGAAAKRAAQAVSRRRVSLTPIEDGSGLVAANGAKMLIHRLVTRAQDGQLVGMEARGRTPWCDAPIRHVDHADPHAAGGQTSWENGSGLCAACNYAKEHPGWTHEAITSAEVREYAEHPVERAQIIPPLELPGQLPAPHCRASERNRQRFEPNRRQRPRTGRRRASPEHPVGSRVEEELQARICGR